MRRVLLFGEDLVHEIVVGALVRRMARDRGMSIEVTSRSCVGGRGTVLSQVRAFVKELPTGTDSLPDLLVVALDANCRGYANMRDLALAAAERLHDILVPAIPDPHIERWLLADPSAFKKVVGKGCATPSTKCEKGLYKRLLFEAVRDAGVVPPLGGIEYAEEIASALDLTPGAQMQDSLARFVSDFTARLRQWT